MNELKHTQAVGMEYLPKVSHIPGAKQAIQAMNKGTKMSNGLSGKDSQELFFTITSLLGLRGDEVPNDYEKQIIQKMLVSDFPNLTPQEVFVAFKLAMNGKLKDDRNKTIDLNTYGRVFNYNLISCVLRAYKISVKGSIQKVISSEQSKEKTYSEMEKERIRNEFLQECILKPIKNYILNNLLDFKQLDLKYVITELKIAKIYSPTPEEEVEIWEQAKEQTLKEWESKIQTKQFESREEATEIKNAINDILSEKKNETFHKAATKKAFEIAIEQSLFGLEFEEVERKILRK